MKFKPGDQVRLHIPGNPRLHGASAIVLSLQEWGAHVQTDAAATGAYRAHWSEMLPVDGGQSAQVATACGYTGDVCPRCQGMQMLRIGPCLQCQECFWNSGCG